MDGDVFGKVSRIGRDAAEAVLLALETGYWDPFCARRCAELLLSRADGVASLPGVLETVRRLNDAPLLARIEVEAACQEVGAVVDREGKTILDLMLRNAVQTSLLRGDLSVDSMMQRFAQDVLNRVIVYGDESPIDLGNAAQVHGACEQIAPVADALAAELVRRPDAKRVGLTRNHPRITATTRSLVFSARPCHPSAPA